MRVKMICVRSWGYPTLHGARYVMHKEKALSPGWPNGLATESTQVFCLRSTVVSFGHPLALTCDDLSWLWSTQIRTQVDASFSPFGHPTQVDTSWSQVNCRRVKFATFCDLRIRLAGTHRKSVRKFWFGKIASNRIDLRIRLASKFVRKFWFSKLASNYIDLRFRLASV